MTPGFLVAVVVVAIASGATASVVGFGIGSLLTPLIATRIGMSAAVAVVTLPHAAATALRCWRLRASVDVSVLKRFGTLSALGGLAGALAYTQVSSRVLTLALAALLLATSAAALTSWSSRWKPQGPMVGALGFASGGFGGLAGNQGGLRAAALLSFGLAPTAFVATATATALMVDAARAPVYVWRSAPEMWTNGVVIGAALAGVIVGTLIGERVLFGISPERFRKIVGVAIGMLGVWLCWRA
ncbi:MAG TPA: TSUP family transporter [Gemmatimonadaceae bacterium]